MISLCVQNRNTHAAAPMGQGLHTGWASLELYDPGLQRSKFILPTVGQLLPAGQVIATPGLVVGQ
jgi:hypothetical protein